VVTRHGPLFTMLHMGEMTAHAATSIVELPVRVWNVAAAITGQEERSRIGGSRIAGEVASSEAEGLDVGGKAALLGSVIGSFNLFIGVFYLMSLDGGHIAHCPGEDPVRGKADGLRLRCHGCLGAPFCSAPRSWGRSFPAIHGTQAVDTRRAAEKETPPSEQVLRAVGTSLHCLQHRSGE